MLSLSFVCRLHYSVSLGLSQNPICATSSNTNGLIVTPVGGSVLVDTTVDTDPVCIRCGNFGTLFTDPNEVVYFFNGMAVTSSTPGFNITDEGLIVDDPASTFTDGEQGTCVVASQSVNNAITINFLGKYNVHVCSTLNCQLVCIKHTVHVNVQLYMYAFPPPYGVGYNALVHIITYKHKAHFPMTRT